MDHDKGDRVEARRRRRRLLVAMLLASSLATIGAGASSLAYFSDNSQSSAGSWTSGTIVLGVTPTTAWTATNILPGDSGSQTIHVANSGTGQLRYAMSTVISGETKSLSSQLSLTISSGACPAATGNVYATGPVGSGAFGNLATHTGRVLNAGASEDLCFAWSFNSSAGNAFQGGAATATFNFFSEQTANNP